MTIQEYRVKRRPSRDTLTGTETTLLLVLRRNRVRLLVWWLTIVGLFVYVIAYYRTIFTTQDALDDFAKISNTPAIKAITGLAAAPATMGGAVWTKIWMTCALTLALAVVFLVTRNGRADEEVGRTELLRSYRLGSHATSAATWLITSLLCLAVGAGVAVASIIGQLDPAGQGVIGSLILGASVSGVGLVGVAVAALAGQITSTSRAANALAVSVLGVFYLMRMVGDLGDGSLTWASPIGWGQQMQPWGENRWWPLLLTLSLVGALLALSLRIEMQRDLGSGLLHPRSGPAAAPRRYGTPLGLALRLQRGPIIGWTITITLTGLMMGSVVEAMNSLMADASSSVTALLRGTGTNALLSLLTLLLAMFTTVFAVQSALSLRSDEASGILEPQLAGSVSRVRWALERLCIPAVGSAALLVLGGALIGVGQGASSDQGSHVVTLALSALTYWPAVMLVVGVVVALFGWVPRLSVALSWGVLGAMWAVVLIGDALRLPTWLMNLLPFSATPYRPLEAMSWPPVLLLSVVAFLLWWLGLSRFARRDIQSD